MQNCFAESRSGVNLKAKHFGTIEDLNDREDLSLISDSQDVQQIKDHLGNHPEINEFDSFFVKIEDGEYVEIFAFWGSVPYLGKTLFKVR